MRSHNVPVQNLLRAPLTAPAQRAYRAGGLSADRVRAALRSWIVHASHANTYRLRARLLRAHPFVAPERPR